MSQIGRISGPLLEENLVRNGVDLTFRNYGVSEDLLYIDVVNKRIGINKTPSTRQLEVNGTTHTTNLIADTADFASITLTSNLFSTDISTPINIRPNVANPLVLMDHMQAGNLDFKDNIIRNNNPNGSIFFDPNGTGIVDIYANSTINGDLTVTGNTQLNGNLTEFANIFIGDSPIDTVVINPDFTQSIIPGDNNQYDLGTPSKRWGSIYVHQNLDIGTLYYNDFTVGLQMFIESGEPRISTIQSNDDLILNPDTGIFRIERYTIEDDTITNIDETAGIVTSTGIGYTRFIANNGVVIPAGNDAQRSFPSSPEVGTTRWTTQDSLNNYLECFDGSIWLVSTGPGGTITPEENYDISNAYILMLG